MDGFLLKNNVFAFVFGEKGPWGRSLMQQYLTFLHGLNRIIPWQKDKNYKEE